MQRPARQYKYYDFVMVAFVVVIVCSNLIGPAKNRRGQPADLGHPGVRCRRDLLPHLLHLRRHPDRGLWLRSRPSGDLGGLWRADLRVVHGGHRGGAAPAGFWKHQAAYEVAFGNTWRIVAASIFAFWCGSFVNALVLAKMKVWTAGRWLWMRTIGSTIFGEAVDSVLFYPLAFWGTGIIPNDVLPKVMLAQFVLKTLVEVLFTPVTYLVVGFLKRVENEDYFDRDTNFNPFKIDP